MRGGKARECGCGAAAKHMGVLCGARGGLGWVRTLFAGGTQPGPWALALMRIGEQFSLSSSPASNDMSENLREGPGHSSC